MILRSLLTTDNPMNSTEELLQWIRSRNREVKVNINKIPFVEMENWIVNPDGSLSHKSGKFFSIVGIDVTTDFGNVGHWR